MAIFLILIENEFHDQNFLLEADDFIDVTMKAADLVAEIDRKAAEKTGATDLSPTKVQSIQDTGALWANEQGIQKFMENVVIYQEEDD